MIEQLAFQPLPGLTSPHAQTIMASFSRPGLPPPSKPLVISLDDGDALWCNLSTPLSWQPHQKTIVMIHGLGGSHISNYMVRIGRKLYQTGYRIVRVNLRGCGPGKHLARFPYHGGISQDILSVIQTLKQETPTSPIVLIGFSLGGNIALKLAGELGQEGHRLLHHTIAICPPINLARTLDLLSLPSNRLYHRYYLGNMQRHVKRWAGKQSFSSIYDFDNTITAPQWGFQDALDYYRQCSSQFFLSRIQHSCHLLFATDDPFIDYLPVLEIPLSPHVKIGLCRHGGHMGFLGWAGKKHRYFWLDSLVQSWINQEDSLVI